MRVILLGGSVLYSGLAGARLAQYGRVSSADTIAPYLEAMLAADPRFAGRKVEVINTAVNFNRIVEIASAYLEEYLYWQPDLVVVFGSINNFYWYRHAGDVAAGHTALQLRHPFRLEFERQVNEHSLAAFIERSRQVDTRLHDLIASSCGNAFLAKELGRLKILFRAFRDLSYTRHEARNDVDDVQ